MNAILKGHTGEVNAVTVTGDGQYAVSGSSDQTLRLWDLKQRTCLKVFTGHGHPVQTVAVTRDNRRLLSGARDGSLKLWDLEKGQCIRTLEGHTGAVNTVAVLNSGNLAVSGSSDCSLRLWNLGNGQCLRIFKEHPACYDMDGMNHLISSSNYEFAYHDYIQDLAHGRTFNTQDFSFLGHAAGVTSLAVTDNGKYIVSGSNDHTLRLWDLKTGQCLWIFGGMNGEFFSVKTVTLTGNQHTVIAGMETIRSWRISGKFFRRLLWPMLRRERCKVEYPDLEDGVNTLAFVPKGKRLLVAGSWHPTLRLLKYRNGRCLKEFKGHEGTIHALAVTPNSNLALSAGSDHTIRVWRL